MRTKIETDNTITNGEKKISKPENSFRPGMITGFGIGFGTFWAVSLNLLGHRVHGKNHSLAAVAIITTATLGLSSSLSMTADYSRYKMWSFFKPHNKPSSIQQEELIASSALK